MARPVKTGLSYFPFDIDFYEDFKIIDLLTDYGTCGVMIYQVILCKVYKEGYYLEINLDNLASKVVRIIGSKWIKNKNFVLQVIQYCAGIGLFDNVLLSQSVITSVGIQRRYAQVTVRNKVNKNKYWLLDKNTNQVAEKAISKNSVSDAETLIDETETDINEKSIIQKKNKQKEIKSNKIRVKESSSQLKIALKDNSQYVIDEEMIDSLQQIYKNTDVLKSLRKLTDYLNRNNDNRRDISGIENYIHIWLEQDNINKNNINTNNNHNNSKKKYVEGIDYF